MASSFGGNATLTAMRASDTFGAIGGARPEFKVGDKARVLKNRAARPKVPDSSIAAGFERFGACKEPAVTLNRKPLVWPGQGASASSKAYGRRVTKSPVPRDRPSGKRCMPWGGRPEPVQRGRRHAAEKRSEVSMGPHFDRKKPVVAANGKRVMDNTSGSWEFHEMYGRLKQFGGTKTKSYAHGIFPHEPNYPPDRDGSGKLIDYSLQQHGGMLCDRGLRTVITEHVPPTELDKRAPVPRGAAERHRRQQRVNKVNAGELPLEQFTTQRFEPRLVAHPSSSSKSAPRKVSSGRSGGGGGGHDWRDTKIAQLKAELASLQSSSAGGV